jgi:post-segregation antitoxin (ccd killing protein)
MKRRTIGENPLDAVIPAYPKPEGAGLEGLRPASGTRKKRLTVYVPEELLEKARDAAFWTPALTLSDLVVEALKRRLEEMERERGEPFPPRPSRLRPGRPMR